jgi:thymidine phosphorylase
VCIALTPLKADVTLASLSKRMRAVDVIRKKRDSGELSREEINFLVSGYTRGEIPDYQMAAWLMAV